MQCLDALGGEGLLAYTNPSRNFLEPILFQMSHRLKGRRQREEARSHIKLSDSHNNNPPSSSIINIDPNFHPRARERADAHTATMKASVLLSTIAACLLPMAAIAAASEGAHGLIKRGYAFHGSPTAKASVRAGVLITPFIQLSRPVFIAAHN